MVERSSFFEFEAGSGLRTCPAEDLLVLKLFAFRPRDVLDAETIVIRQRAAVDWQYIATNLAAAGRGERPAGDHGNLREAEAGTVIQFAVPSGPR
jgi:acyl dehydratase